MSDQSEKLAELFKDSSNHTRNQLIAFLVFLVYMVISVGSTTDMLLLTGKPFKLPVIGVELPLFYFFLVTPFVVVFFHLYVLFTLVQHRVNLHRWYEDKKDKLPYQDEKPYPFLFNYLDDYEEGELSYLLLKMAIYIVGYLLPLTVLVMIQIIFSEYHSCRTTVLHYCLILLDTLFLMVYWPRVMKPESEDKESKSEISTRVFFYHLKIYTLELIKYVRNFKGRILILLILVYPTINLVILGLVEVNSQIVVCLYNDEIGRKFVPYLDVSRKTITASAPSDTIIQRLIKKYPGDNAKEIKEKAWIHYSKGFNLRGRDLRFANFKRAKLYKVNFRSFGKEKEYTQLQHANFSNAKLQGAIFRNARLQKADFEKASLQGANLKKAQLQGANLSDAQLQGANLSEANLKGADLSFVKLQGADLSDAQLRGADIQFAQLQGANLSEARLQGTYLIKAQLQGANLSEVQLQGADLSFAQLQGADLSDTQLQGADLSDAQLQGAFFNKTQLKGSLFSKKSIVKENGAPEKAIDWKTPKSEAAWKKMWDTIITNLNKIKMSLTNDEVVKRIDEAIERSEKAKNKTYFKEYNLKHDKNQFMKIHQKLACEDIYVAEGMLKQYYPDDIEETKIFDYMKNECRDKLIKIQERKKLDDETHKLIDKELREKGKKK